MGILARKKGRAIMSLREQDFLLRQIQQLIQGFGKQTTIESVKMYIQMDDGVTLSDVELEEVIIRELLLVTNSDADDGWETMANKVGIDATILESYIKGKESLANHDISKLKDFFS